MELRPLTAELLAPELEFTTSRSSGPGGQNVNKVNTKVTLRFNISQSRILTDEEKQLLSAKLARQISTDGYYQISAQENRSQIQNKELVVEKFNTALTKAFVKKKPRKKSKPSKTAVQKRLDSKKRHSEKKSWRKNL
jgi:ribosome-associated protein